MTNEFSIIFRITFAAKLREVFSEMIEDYEGTLHIQSGERDRLKLNIQEFAHTDSGKNKFP
jgi:hypothetical protein